jgi:mersacidin/lichenicidin family type 2 lantibiotic
MKNRTSRSNRTELSKRTIVRAWVDPGFRATLSQAELALLPPNPAGEGVPEEALQSVVGGFTFGSGCGTYGCFTACATSSTCTPQPCW